MHSCTIRQTSLPCQFGNLDQRLVVVIITLRRFDGMHPRGAFFSTNHFIRGREVHVFRAANGDSALGQLVRIIVLGDQSLQFIWSDL